MDASEARRAALLDQAFAYVIAEYGKKDYGYWEALIGKDPTIVPHPEDKNIEIDISPIWDTARGGLIRVLVSILNATRFGISLPTTSFLIDRQNRIDAPPRSNS